MKIKKIVWLLLGFGGLGLGALGAVLPLLPSVPFLMLALFSFGKSSEKLHSWFTGTKLYRDNLESFVQRAGHDAARKAENHGHGHAFDGVWLLYDAARGGSFSPAAFWPASGWRIFCILCSA